MKAWIIFYNTLILPSFLFSKDSDENFSKIATYTHTIEVPENEQFWKPIQGTNPVGYFRVIAMPSNLQNKNIISIINILNYHDDDYIVVGAFRNQSITLINFNANLYDKIITLKITYYR